MVGQQARLIDSTDPDEVLKAAARLLRREFGRVNVVAETRTVMAGPTEYRTTRESGTARDLYRGGSAMRRVGRLNIGRRGDSVIARLRIDVERQDTARAAAVGPPTGRLSDTPAVTPIERDAATTERQNTVWTFVRRDERLERALLEELQELFAAPPPPRQPAGEQSAAERPAGAP